MRQSRLSVFRVLSVFLFIFASHLFHGLPTSHARQEYDAPKMEVEGWMTLGDVADTFCIPLEKLNGRFDIPEEKVRTVPIVHLGLKVAEVQDAVDRFWDPEAIREARENARKDTIIGEDGKPVEFAEPPAEEWPPPEPEDVPPAEAPPEPERLPLTGWKLAAYNLGISAAGLALGLYLLRRRRAKQGRAANRAAVRKRP